MISLRKLGLDPLAKMGETTNGNRSIELWGMPFKTTTPINSIVLIMNREYDWIEEYWAFPSICQAYRLWAYLTRKEWEGNEVQEELFSIKAKSRGFKRLPEVWHTTASRIRAVERSPWQRVLSDSDITDYCYTDAIHNTDTPLCPKPCDLRRAEIHVIMKLTERIRWGARIREAKSTLHNVLREHVGNLFHPSELMGYEVAQVMRQLHPSYIL